MQFITFINELPMWLLFPNVIVDYILLTDWNELKNNKKHSMDYNEETLKIHTWSAMLYQGEWQPLCPAK